MTARDAVISSTANVVDAALEATIVGSFSKLGYLARRRLFRWDEPAEGALDGQVVLVTGATSGLGAELAHEVARLGATTIVSGRDQARTEAARDTVRSKSGNDDVHVVVADLCRLDDVRRAADRLAADHDRIDVLVHNAGALVHDYQETVDGLEVTAQTHVVAPFLLTAAVWPQLTAAAHGRVITVTSGGMYTARLDVDALDTPDPDHFDGVRRYALAKRAQVVLTAEWAKRSIGSGVSFHAMHPGWADTPGVEAALPVFHRLVGPILRTPAQGVDTARWLATSDDPTTDGGRLWLDRRVRRASYLPHTTTSDTEAARLWDWCRHHAGVADPFAPPGPAELRRPLRSVS